MLTDNAPAKVNLYLHVVGKRPDGYHLLESLIAFTDIADVITVKPSDKLTLSLSGTYAHPLADESDNIVLKAAKKLAAYAGIEPHVHIDLKKEIPLGAGLGGGSSDAATALKLLVRLWKLDIPDATLMKIALELGADVPVMLKGKASFIAGIGEVVIPIKNTLGLPAVLVNPGVFLSTPAVFKQGVKAFSTPESDVIATFTHADRRAFLLQRKNDLETPAITLQPAIQEVLDVISRQRGCVFSRMSGSGATCFGIFTDNTMAQDAAKHIQQTQPDWWVRNTVIQ